jgi:4-amino-4-deoxy-L-arabinose transferase-like glycosyltransferase
MTGKPERMQPPVSTKVKLYWLAFVLLTAVAAVRIESAAAAYFETADETFHIACGMWWLDGRYPETCIDHSPLARVAGALPLYLRGIRPADYSVQAVYEGTADFRSRGEYEKNLALARWGVLPFFVLASLVVWLWARRLYGYPTALAAVFLFQGLPPVLAHAGLVATDLALTACLPLAFFALTLWLDRASSGRGVLLGVTLGLAILAKHSALPFFLVGAFLIVLAWGIETLGRERWNGRAFRHRVAQLCLALLATVLVAWAGYRFSLVPLSRASWRPHTAVSRLLHIQGLLERHPSLRDRFNRVLEMPVPAGNLLLGLSKVAHRDGLHGRWSYFMGEVSENGWKLFFPALVVFKSPIAFLLLLAAGLAFFRRRDPTRPLWERLAPLLGAAGVMAVAIAAPINIGVRHVLPVYAMLSIEAGAGLVALLGAARWRAASRALAAVLAAWFVVSSAMAHPDYLPYFNELAGREPQRIAISSDLDWNQDLKRLMVRMQELHADRLAIHCDGCWLLILPNLPPLPGSPSDIRLLKPYEPTDGWVAVSEWSIRVRVAWEKIVAGRQDGAFDWLAPYPYTRIGKSIRLYYVPPKP